MTDTTKTRKWFRIAAIACIAAFLLAIASFAFQGERTPDPVAAQAETIDTTTTIESDAKAIGFDLPANDEVPDTYPDYQPSDDNLAEDQVEEQVEDQLDDDEPQDEPDPLEPALLAVPYIVQADSDGYVEFEVSNLGDETLEIEIVEINGAPILPVELPQTVAGSESETMSLQVMLAQVGIGQYQFSINIKSNGGEETVQIKGTKAIIALPMDDDIDVQDHIVMNHGVNLGSIQVVNNEDHDVVITMTTDDNRLLIYSEWVLSPGMNQVLFGVEEANVPAFFLETLTFTVAWDNQEVDVKVTKYGS